jgi:hypothetical protein
VRCPTRAPTGSACYRVFGRCPGVERAAKPRQMSHQLFRSPPKLCAGSRGRIQMADPANRSPRLVIKTLFCNQLRASPRDTRRESYLGAVEALKGDRVFPFGSGVTKSERFSDLALASAIRGMNPDRNARADSRGGLHSFTGLPTNFALRKP